MWSSAPQSPCYEPKNICSHIVIHLKAMTANLRQRRFGENEPKGVNDLGRIIPHHVSTIIIEVIIYYTVLAF